MSMSRLSAVALAAGLLLAGCDKAASQAPSKAPSPPAAVAQAPASPAPVPPAPLSGFSHQPGFDIFGYYLPKAPVQVGTFVLRQIHVGSAEEFAAHEQGQRISPDYAPLMLEFDDLAGQAKVGEPDQLAVTRRVLPSAYRVTPQGIWFRGFDEVLGTVTFEGRLDAAALERVRAGGGDEPVLNGIVTLRGQRFARAFAWFGGD